MIDKNITGEASFTWDEIKGDLFTVAMTGSSMWGSAKDFGTSYCFVAGTLVTTEDGFKPIEGIEVGDRVLSENEQTGEVAVKTATAAYVNEINELIHIGVNWISVLREIFASEQNERNVKAAEIRSRRKAYVITDHSKFNQNSY